MDKNKLVSVKNNIDISEYFQAMILDQDSNVAFYSHILQRTRRVKTDKMKTMAIGIDHSGFVLLYNPEFIGTLTYEKFCYICKHELLHAVLGHHSRAGAKPTRLDNIAMDLAINSMLGDIDMDLMYPGKPVKDAEGNITNPFKDFPQGETYEQYYNRLLKLQKSGKKPKKGHGNPAGGKGNQQGQGEDGESELDGVGDPQENGDTEVNFDGHKERAEADGEATDAVARKVINEAYKTCKMQGTLPGNLERIIEGRLKAKVNWKTQMRRFHGRFHIMGTRFTNKKANRRMPKLLGVIPGVRNKYTARLLIVFDTSGSVDERQHKQFMAEASRIPVPFTLMQCDAEICDIKKVRRARNFKSTMKGGGGTDFRPPFEYAKKNGYDGVIYLTDMYGTFPERCNLPTLWVSTTDVDKAPFGKVINIKLNEQEEA